jgi:ATP phosphoribosyltransferase
MLNGAINALSQVGLMLNVPKANLDEILSILPALSSPTVSHLKDENWVAVNTILSESTVREVVPKLKAAGGSGIVEYPLSKVVL